MVKIVNKVISENSCIEGLSAPQSLSHHFLDVEQTSAYVRGSRKAL